MKLTERNKGILCILMAAFFFSLMTVFVRLAGDLPTMEKVLFRNLVAAIVSFGMLMKSREKVILDKTNYIDLFFWPKIELKSIIY